MRYRLEYLAARMLMAGAGVMSDRLRTRCGTLLGSMAYALDGRRRRTALRNLAMAFPSRDPRERRAIALAAFGHLGRLFFELLKFGTLSPAEMLARVEFEGADRAHLAYARGHGVLFFTGHFGYWELQAMVHAARVAPVGVVARALDNPELNELLEAIRERTGNTVVYRKGTIRHILRMLHAGQGVAVLIDQHMQPRDAVYVDFFGRPAATTSALAALALRTGAPVLPVFALPIAPGRYRMIYEDPVEPPPADSENAVREFTQRCTAVLEAYVRRHPDLWLWMHRRWRDGETQGDPS